MLKAHQGAEVDIIDRLLTPFGLVRAGVAPDHPETKIVINQFTRVVQHERCSFFGNVTLGSSISLAELRELYHVVVLAYGAESDRDLGIPGEDLSGIHSAREFVWWYNGHPDGKNLNPDLKSTDTAIILGQGNVALDVARILLRPTTELATTDIASHALAALNQSSIRKVYLVGRRGPVQAACTAKELREVLGIKDLYIHIKEVDLLKSSEDEYSQRLSRLIENLMSVLRRTGHVAGVHFEKTVLKGAFLSMNTSDGLGVGPGKQVAEGTGKFEDLDCGMVLKSIGYKSVPVDGLPFDHQKGVVPNASGRVLTDALGDQTLLEKGLYVCGWLKRGPTGIIATNLYCAEETVASISQDLEQGTLAAVTSLPKPGREGLLQLLDDEMLELFHSADGKR
ncbi:hypothetical protein GH714_004448 [Hevea brasiliensis]|uniref:adrenodoxin-NADP(+) reductase n=1 Tax=Hevea brasiliensis TaxID=3981 RepID=A0A6A6M9V8_HEVBR|nr:hypothetical protein GH714_004448 [Hevea brasiliensis]